MRRADVKTPDGLVVEMQNSPIRPQEVRSREDFYGKIVWIVNGDRQGTDGRSQTLDRRYFNMGRSSHPIRLDPLAFPVTWSGKSKLLHNWSKATAAVYFDFGGEILWRLDSFEPNKTIFLEESTPAYGSTGTQCELFTASENPRNKQIKINLGVFTPIHIDYFVECSKRGRAVQGGFGLSELGLFKKEFVVVDTVGSHVPGDV